MATTKQGATLNGDGSEPTVPAGTWLAVRFSGSGRDYFRIWIVNLLLRVVTLGLYHPWAKVRRLRYFHTHTRIGGQPMDYHADPRKMLRGYLLVVLLAMLYSMASEASRVAGLLAFVVIALIWPVLLTTSMRFRLANTSWRGQRLRFTGTLRGAYLAGLPMLVVLVLVMAAYAALPAPSKAPTWLGLLGIVAFIAGLLTVPWLWWRLKRYQHDHFAYGREHTTLHAGQAAFYKVFQRTGTFTLGGLLALLALGFGVVYLLVASGTWGALAASARAGDLQKLPPRGLLVGLLILPIAWVFLHVLPRAYFRSQMQNLLWSTTASPSLRMRSRLRFGPLARLTIRNGVLTLLTLGLYWPYAAIAMARLRLEAVELEFLASPSELGDAKRTDPGTAAGDAAGDVFDMDIGL